MDDKVEFNEIMKHTAMALKVFEQVDEEIRKLPNCCRKGCSHCCHQCILINSTELYPIFHYLSNAVSLPVIAQIVKQLSDWVTYMKANLNYTSFTVPELREFERKVAKDRVPCFFLVNNECSIYKVRPLACRAHIVKSDPELCEENPTRNASNEAYSIRDKAFNELSSFSGTFKPQINILATPIARYFNLL